MHQLTNSTLLQPRLVFGDPDFLSDTDILANGGHLPVFFTTFSLRIRRNCYFRAYG